MPEIPDKSIDMILCDLPYGTTACKWDQIIPFEPLWKEYNRIIKSDGITCLFGNEPFSSIARISNMKYYKYDWKWNKCIPSGMGYAKYQPMRQIEDIMIFYDKSSKYFPIMIKRDKPIVEGGKKFKSESAPIKYFNNMGGKIYEYKNPINILSFMKIRQGSLHPTQKPVNLCEYLIKTYTKENELVLDNCIGSGTTAIACLNTNRHFIGIEKEPKYVEITRKRISEIPRSLDKFIEVTK